MRRLTIVSVAFLAAACGAGQEQSTGAAKGTNATPASVRPAIVVANRPPTRKDVIEAVLASAGVELAVSSTCKNVGTEPTDRTIGRYLAGFMAEMSREDTPNWIETAVDPDPAGEAEPVWICRLTLRHRDREDRWGWGVKFHVRQRDGLVLESSFTCTGAG